MKHIRDNAPEGAEYYLGGVYYKVTQQGKLMACAAKCGCWVESITYESFDDLLEDGAIALYPTPGVFLAVAIVLTLVFVVQFGVMPK